VLDSQLHHIIPDKSSWHSGDLCLCDPASTFAILVSESLQIGETCSGRPEHVLRRRGADAAGPKTFDGPGRTARSYRQDGLLHTEATGTPA
jgi:hypothetical protein